MSEDHWERRLKEWIDYSLDSGNKHLFKLLTSDVGMMHVQHQHGNMVKMVLSVLYKPQGEIIVTKIMEGLD